MSKFSDILNGRKPSIIAFDCDWTLYPYDCDKDRIPPFERCRHGVTDFWGAWADPYLDVPSILGAIYDAYIPVAFLSRNPSDHAVENLLRSIPLHSTRLRHASLWSAMPSKEYFHAYSNGGYGKGKDKHFAALHTVTGIHPNHILFFDDMKENTDAAAAQGITSVLVGSSGLTWDAFQAGIIAWREHLEKIEAAEVVTDQHPQGHNGPA